MEENKIYTFLKDNSLTDKTHEEFVQEYADPSKARTLYSFFTENKLTGKDFDNFYSDNFKTESLGGVQAKTPDAYSSATNQNRIRHEQEELAQAQPTMQELNKRPEKYLSGMSRSEAAEVVGRAAGVAQKDEKEFTPSKAMEVAINEYVQKAADEGDDPTAWQKIGNSLINTWGMIKASPIDVVMGLNIPMAFGDKGIIAIGEKLGWDEEKTNKLRKRYATQMQYAPDVSGVSLANNLITGFKRWDTVAEPLAAGAELSKKLQVEEPKEGGSILKGIKDGDFGEIAAGVVDGTLGFVPSLLVGGLTGGFGFIPWVTGTELVRTVDNEAKLTDQQIKDIFEKGDANLGTSLFVGVATGMLEKFAFTKLTKYLGGKKITEGFAKRFKALATETGRQGIINYIEAILSKYADFYTEEDVADPEALAPIKEWRAAKKTADFAFSEEGAEAGLKAMAGTITMAGGRGAVNQFSGGKEQAATEPTDPAQPKQPTQEPTTEQPIPETPTETPPPPSPREAKQAEITQKTQPKIHKDGSVRIARDNRTSTEDKTDVVFIVNGEVTDPEGFWIRKQDETDEQITRKGDISPLEQVTPDDYVAAQMQEYDAQMAAKERIQSESVVIQGQRYFLESEKDGIVQLMPIDDAGNQMGDIIEKPIEEVNAAYQAEQETAPEVAPEQPAAETPAEPQAPQEPQQPKYPVKKDGTPDIDNMNTAQLFEFNREQFGEETAIADLQGDIALIQEKIDKANKKLEKSDTKTKVKTRMEIQRLTEEMNNLSAFLPQVKQNDTSVPSQDNKKTENETDLQNDREGTGQDDVGQLVSRSDVPQENEPGRVPGDVADVGSELEQKKADIEKRRQEKLNNILPEQEAKNRLAALLKKKYPDKDLSGRLNDAFWLDSFRKEKGLFLPEDVEEGQKLAQLLFEYKQGRDPSAPGRTPQEQINAKYDAELVALEQPEISKKENISKKEEDKVPETKGQKSEKEQTKDLVQPESSQNKKLSEDEAEKSEPKVTDLEQEVKQAGYTVGRIGELYSIKKSDNNVLATGKTLEQAWEKAKEITKTPLEKAVEKAVTPELTPEEIKKKEKAKKERAKRLSPEEVQRRKEQRALALSIEPVNMEQLILQWLVNPKVRLDTDELRTEVFPDSPSEMRKRIWLHKKGGERIDENRDIMNGLPFEDAGNEANAFRNAVLEVILRHDTQQAMIERILEIGDQNNNNNVDAEIDRHYDGMQKAMEAEERQLQQEIDEIWTKHIENIDENITKEQLNELFLGYETEQEINETGTPGLREGESDGNREDGTGSNQGTQTSTGTKREEGLTELKSLESNLKQAKRAYNTALNKYNKLNNQLKNSPEFGNKGQADMSGNVAGSDVLDFGSNDLTQAREAVKQAKAESDRAGEEVTRLNKEIERTKDKIRNQGDLFTEEQATPIDATDRVPVVGIGDLHGENPTELKKDLVEAGIIDSDNYWLTDKTVVQIGDVSDRGEHTNELIDFLDDISLKSNDKLVRLLGNHDLFHIMGRAEALRAEPNSQTTKKLYDGVISGRIKAAWVEGNTIYTHAGIDLSFFPEFKDMTPKQIADNLNERLMYGVLNKNYNDKIFDTENGIFWTRRNLENDKFRQVVGHTVKAKQHTYKDGDRVKYIDTGRIFGGDRALFQNTEANKPVFQTPLEKTLKEAEKRVEEKKQTNEIYDPYRTPEHYQKLTDLEGDAWVALKRKQFAIPPELNNREFISALKSLHKITDETPYEGFNTDNQEEIISKHLKKHGYVARWGRDEDSNERMYFLKRENQSHKLQPESQEVKKETDKESGKLSHKKQPLPEQDKADTGEKEVPGVSKQPWEITEVEFAQDTENIKIDGSVEIVNDKPVYTYKTTINGNSYEIQSRNPLNGYESARRLHKKSVQQALSEGRTISDNVKKDYPELFEEKQTGEYKYHLRSRPFSIGTYPQNDNFVRYEEDNTPFGKVVYSSPLLMEDIKKFELVPEGVIEPGRYDMKVGNDYFPVDVTLIKTQKGHDAVVVNGVGKGYNANFSAVDFIEGVEQGKWVKKESKPTSPVSSENKESNRESPLMNQYNSIKKKYPGAIVLFRVGDFYETFGEDAVKISEILGIALTENKTGDKLSGFPAHAIDEYLPKLVKAGNKVALAEEIQSKPESKFLDDKAEQAGKDKKDPDIRFRGSGINIKQKQLDIILKSNPMQDDIHTGIRIVDDIKTLEEAINDPEWQGYDEFNPDYTLTNAKEALESGKITVYSSYPIKSGVFVSPSRMEAESYSGSGEVYSKQVNINDVAWIDPTQGQYAKTKDDIRFRKASPLYSPTEKALEQIKQDKGKPDQMKATLLKNGAKQAELDYMGWDEAFTGKSVTKAEIQEWIDGNKVEIEEVTKTQEANDEFDIRYNENADGNKYEVYRDGDKGKGGQLVFTSKTPEGAQRIINEIKTNPAKYNRPDLVLPGGEKYREIVMTMPVKSVGISESENTELNRLQYKKEEFGLSDTEAKDLIELQEKQQKIGKYQKPDTFQSSHWPDEVNPVAHIRINDRTDVESRRLLHAEEIQSDLGEEWRNLKKKIDAGTASKEDIARFEFLDKNFPFNRTPEWTNLILRRLAVYAAENGYNGISWTPGEQQAERYNLSKHFNRIIWIPGSENTDNRGRLESFDKNNKSVVNKTIDPKDLEDYVGKDMANELINSTPDENGMVIKDGLDLKVGDQKMKTFYDEIVRNQANKIFKKFGAKVSTTKINIGNDINEDTGEYIPDNMLEVMYLPMTEKLFQTAMGEGFPMFQASKGGFLPDKIKSNNLKKYFNRLFANAKNAGTVHVVHSINEIPEGFRQRANEMEGAQGFYLPGTGETYLITGNIQNAADAFKTWVHEVGVHRGLSNIIPNHLLNPMFEKFYDDLGQAEIQANIPENYHDKTKAEQAEEYMAYLGEKITNEKDISTKEKGFWTRLIDAVKDILNKLFTGVKFTKADAERIVKAAVQSVYQPPKGPKNKKYSVSSRNETVQEQKQAYPHEGSVPGWKLSGTAGQYVHSNGSRWNVPKASTLKGETYRKLNEIIENTRAKRFDPDVFDYWYEKLRDNSRTPNAHLNSYGARGNNITTIAHRIYDYLPHNNYSPDIRFKTIGEKGAANLDRAQEATVRFDNLQVAREMEAANKTPKEIRLATGWEKGADGKWRYETGDIRSSVKKYGKYKLKDILADNSLLKEYPELKKYKVDIVLKTGRHGHLGSFNPKKKEITIWANDKKQLDSTLNHEVQHAIQDIEGFASGGNLMTAAAEMTFEEQKEIKELIDSLPELESLMNDSRFGSQTRRAAAEAYVNAKDRIEELSPRKRYERLAGEVESRNVQSRMGMTEQQRRETLLADTEDVARKDQIFLQNAGIAESRGTEKPERKDYPFLPDYLKALEEYYKQPKQEAPETPKQEKVKSEKPGYQELIDNLKETLEPYYGKGTAGEKGRQAKRREIVEQFVRENADNLKKLRDVRIPISLKDVNKAARTDKGLRNAIARLETAVNDSLNRLAKKKATDFIKELSEIKTTQRESGMTKAANFLQEGVDYRDAVVQIAQMDSGQLDSLRDAIDGFMDGETEVVEGLGFENESLEKLAQADLIHNLIDTYGNLKSKKLSDVENAIETWKGDFASLKEDFKRFREAELKRKQKLQDDFYKDTTGDATNFDKRKFNELLTQKERLSPKHVSKYQEMSGTIASLTHAIWRGYTEGQKSKDFFKSNIFKAYKAVDRGSSAKADMQFEMKQRVGSYITDLWGSDKAFKKELESEVEITLIRTEKDGKTGETKEVSRRVSISTDNAMHLWMSWQSEANKPYMDRIEFQKEKHKMTEETYSELTRKLSDNAKDFARILSSDYFGSNEYYQAVNGVLKRKTGRNLPQLAGYVPVNANRYGNHIPYDVTNLGIYRSIVKERRYGLYDIDRNGMFRNAMEYADKVSSFVHLSEAVSDFAYTLNSRKVQSGLIVMGTNGKAQRIIDLLNKGYNQQRTDGTGFGNWLLRRFVSTKILMNYNLLPKQLVSTIAMLDSDFGNPAGVFYEFSRYMSGTSNKEVTAIAKELVRNHPDLKFRNITDIESLTKKGRNAIHIHMFGTDKKSVARGMLATAVWNPTAVGDRIAITAGGMAIVIHNYKEALVYAKEQGMTEDKAKTYAAQAATDMLAEFIGTTQQSGKITHKSAVQYGGYRMFTAFMNSLMAYQRKVTRHARDVNRDYQAGKKRRLEAGEDPTLIGAKAIRDIPASKIISLLIYSTLMPVLWETVTTLGGNWKRMWDDDDETKKEARWKMLFDSTLGWTKGLFGIGFLMEYGVNQLMGRSYGKRDDNIVPVLDDAIDIIDVLVKGWKLLNEYDDVTIKKRPKYEQELRASMAQLGITSGGLFLGAPVTFLHRIFDVSSNKEYKGDILRSAARLYGVPKEELERIFDNQEYQADGIVNNAKKFNKKLNLYLENDYDQYVKMRDSKESVAASEIIAKDKQITQKMKSIDYYTEREDSKMVSQLEDEVDRLRQEIIELNAKP